VKKTFVGMLVWQKASGLDKDNSNETDQHFFQTQARKGSAPEISEKPLLHPMDVHACMLQKRKNLHPWNGYPRVKIPVKYQGRWTAYLTNFSNPPSGARHYLPHTLSHILCPSHSKYICRIYWCTATNDGAGIVMYDTQDHYVFRHVIDPKDSWAVKIC